MGSRTKTYDTTNNLETSTRKTKLQSHKLNITTSTVFSIPETKNTTLNLEQSTEEPNPASTTSSVTVLKMEINNPRYNIKVQTKKQNQLMILQLLLIDQKHTTQNPM